MDLAAQVGRQGTNRFGKLGEEWEGTRIEDPVNSVQSKSVDVKLLKPVQRILDEEVADFTTVGAIEVQSRSPGRAITLRTIGAVLAQVIAFRPEVLVNHLQRHLKFSRY